MKVSVGLYMMAKDAQYAKYLQTEQWYAGGSVIIKCRLRWCDWWGRFISQAGALVSYDQCIGDTCHIWVDGFGVWGLAVLMICHSKHAFSAHIRLAHEQQGGTKHGALVGMATDTTAGV